MRVVEGSGFDLSLVAAGGTPLRIVNVWGDIGMLRKFVTVAISAAALGGCATIDTGYIDYRRAEDPANVADQISGYDGTCAPSKADPKVVNTICYPLLGSKLFRKNTSSKIGIQEQDVYSVRLDHGHMRYVSEFPLRPGRVLDGKNPFRAQAEIVVLARAFEFGPVAKADLNALVTSTEPQAAAESRPTGVPADEAFVDVTTDSLNDARVIYYSPDVENGQSLNFSNIPILGPVRYGGRPVGIQIIVLELDRVSEEMQGLLSSLASLGQTAGAIPTGGASDILLGLGKTLLESNQDDVVFEYRFVLDPSHEVNSYNSAPFEEGRYVLRRLQTRKAAHVWRDIQLDHNTGQLFLLPEGENNEAKLYTDETYFTVNIINHGASAKEAVYVYKSLQDLRSLIDASAQASDTNVATALDGQIQIATKNLRGNALTRELASTWEEVAGDARRLAFAFAPADAPPLTDGETRACIPEPSSGVDKGAAEYELAKDVAAFVRGWNTAIQQDGDVVRFEAGERLRVADAVASFFFSTDSRPDELSVEPDSFVDPTEFGALISATGDTSLLARVKGYIEAMRPKSCKQLVALGLARWEPSSSNP